MYPSTSQHAILCLSLVIFGQTTLDAADFLDALDALVDALKTSDSVEVSVRHRLSCVDWANSAMCLGQQCHGDGQMESDGIRWRSAKSPSLVGLNEESPWFGGGM